MEDKKGNVWICSSQDFIGGEGIRRSADGGLTWQAFNKGLPNGYTGSLMADEKGNVFCGMMNDAEDGLYWYNESIDAWQAVPIQVQLGTMTYKLRSVREGIPFTPVVRNLLLTPQGNIHASIPTTGATVLYNKMFYHDSWVNYRDGVAPRTYGLAFFCAMPDGAVIMGNPSNRFYITREGVPGRIPQTIRFDKIGTMHLYDTVTIHATASSGSTIVYAAEPLGGSLVTGNRLWAGNTGVITARAIAPATTDYYYAEERQTVQVRKARNHIQVEALPALIDTSTAVHIKASASSGEKVMIEILSGPAVLNGDVLTATGAGKLVLRFKETGNNSYLPADTTTAAFCIFPQRPVISIVSGASGVMLRSSSTIGNQWYADGNPVNHHTADTLKPSGNGNFTVKVTVDGCASELSAPVVVTPVNEVPAAHPIRIYPGLFSNELHIDHIPAAFTQFTVDIYAVNGTLVLKKTYSAVSQVRLDTKHLPAGVYVVTIRSGKAQVQQKLIRMN